MIDAAKVVAQNAAHQGVKVQWLEFEATPHNWPMLFPMFWQSERCMQEWAYACSSFVHGSEVQARAARVGIDERSEAADVRNLIGLSVTDVQNLMKSRQASVRPWVGRLPVEKL